MRHLTNVPDTKSAAAQTVVIEGEHLPALARFYGRVWNSTATAEEVAAARELEAKTNPAAYGAVPPAFAVLKHDEVIGYVGTMPARIWGGRSEVSASWIKGLMVVPEQRGGPVGYLVLKEAAQRLEVSAGFAVASPAVRLFKALGYTQVCTLTNYVLPLSAGRIASRVDVAATLPQLPPWLLRSVGGAQRLGMAALGGYIVGAPLRLRAIYRQLRMRRVDTILGADSITDAELDSLWDRFRAAGVLSAVRDARYLRWRYGAAGTEYEMVGVREEGQLTALGVIRRPGTESTDPRLRGVRLASLTELIVLPDRPETAGMLLAAVEERSRQIGADAILCSASHPHARHVLRRYGYFNAGGTVNFLLRGAAEAGLSTNGDDWWLTRADGAADEGIG